MAQKSKRIPWDEYALRLAYCASIRSEDPYHQVGACALSYNNRVLGVAYNGLKAGKNPPKGFWKDRDKRRPYMIHAETNILSLFKRDECKILAVTLKPCASCARQICAWNIPLVVYGENYHLDPGETDEIFNFYKVRVKQIRLK